MMPLSGDPPEHRQLRNLSGLPGPGGTAQEWASGPPGEWGLPLCTTKPISRLPQCSDGQLESHPPSKAVLLKLAVRGKLKASKPCPGPIPVQLNQRPGIFGEGLPMVLMFSLN